MTKTIEEITFLGESAVRATNEKLQIIVVPTWGSNLVSFTFKEKQLQLVRSPKSADDYAMKPVLYGAPVLFPPNRISDGTFTFNELTYHFAINEEIRHNHIHGFLYNRKWSLGRQEITADQVIIETEFDSTQYPDVMEQFPHPFIVRMTFILEGATLHKHATIINCGEQSFPWGLGYHTTFLFPFVPGGSLDLCTFSLTAKQKWELNERLLPTGELIEIAGDELPKRIPLKDNPLDDVFLATRESGGNAAILDDRNSGIKLVYRCDENFRHWVVYNNDSRQGYLCPEPYTWVTNAPNLDLPPSITGLQVLEPGKQITVKTDITVTANSEID